MKRTDAQLLYMCKKVCKKKNSDKHLQNAVAQKCYAAEEQMNRHRLHVKSTLSLTITFPFNNIIVSVATAKTQQPGGEGRGVCVGGWGVYQWGKWLWRQTGRRSAPGTWAWRWSCQWSRWRPPGRWGSSVSTRCCWRVFSEMEWNLVEDTQKKFSPLNLNIIFWYRRMF